MLDNNDDFVEGTQAYIWGYTSKTVDINNSEEWVLISNDSWDVPDAVQDGIGENPPLLFWWLDDPGTNAILGNIIPEEVPPGSGFFANSIQSASVPEPSTGLLLLLAGAGFFVRRRRSDN